MKSAAARCPGTALLGFVDAIDVVYGRCKTAISPVIGTGLKIKILDAMDRGKPVFASPPSPAGLLPEHEGCVFPIEADIMDRLLDDPSRLAEVGGGAAPAETASSAEAFLATIAWHRSSPQGRRITRRPCTKPHMQSFCICLSCMRCSTTRW